MADLIDIISNIRETEAAISRLEKTVSKHPDSDSMLLSLKSLHKRQKELERAFSEAEYSLK